MMARDYKGIKFMEAFRFPGPCRAKVFIGRTAGLPIHMHDGVELMYVLQGELRIKISFNQYRLRAGDFLPVNAYEVHSLEAEETADILFLQMDKTFFAGKEFAFDPHFYENYNQEAVKEIKEKAVQAYLSYEAGKQSGETEGLLKRIAAICDSFFQVHQYDVIHKAHMDFSRSGAAGSRMQNIYQFLYDHYDQRLRLSDVAHMEHMDMSYTSRFLKKGGMGEGFQDTLNIIRTDRAEVFLLGTDLPVQQVGEKVGFSSHTYFVKHFKARFGMAPSAYRQKYRNEVYPKKKMELGLVNYGRTELLNLIQVLESSRRKQSQAHLLEELRYGADYLIRLCSEITCGTEMKIENSSLALRQRDGDVEICLKGSDIRIHILQGGKPDGCPK